MANLSEARIEELITEAKSIACIRAVLTVLHDAEVPAHEAVQALIGAAVSVIGKALPDEDVRLVMDTLLHGALQEWAGLRPLFNVQ